MAKKKKAKPAEYRLNIFHASDRETGRRFVTFLVRTVKEFASFNYEISLNVTREGRSIRVDILGMNTPAMIMGGTGPASGRRNLTALQGLYTVIVTKLDRETNEFMITIGPEQVKILQGSPEPFVLTSADPVVE